VVAVANHVQACQPAGRNASRPTLHLQVVSGVSELQVHCQQ
jgi:hypothetical protein